MKTFKFEYEHLVHSMVSVNANSIEEAFTKVKNSFPSSDILCEDELRFGVNLNSGCQIVQISGDMGFNQPTGYIVDENDDLILEQSWEFRILLNEAKEFKIHT